MRLAIEGRIENVGAADIFLFLSQTQRTSVVAFERPDQETRVFFSEGQPVWCTSTKVQLQIESRLAHGGTLKLRDIETALARQSASETRIPQALIAEKLATETSMEKDLRALALDTLRDVAGWTSGSFVVYDGVSAPPWAFSITADFPAILIDALRGQCQKDTLQREFLYRRSLVRVRTPARAVAALNDTERAVLALADGERTLEEILKRSGLDEQQALSAMHVLCGLHLVDLRSPVASPRLAERPAPPPPAPAPVPAPAPAAAPTPPAPPPAKADRGGATDRVAPKAEARPAAPAAPPVAAAAPPAAPRGAEAPGRTGESTAKLAAPPALTQPPPKAAPTRTLRITADEKTEDVVLGAATFAIGRHPRNDLVLKDPRISSFHCRIEVEAEGCVILDLKSRNGTLVNSIRVERAVLKPNDRVQLGSTKITYLES